MIIKSPNTLEKQAEIDSSESLDRIEELMKKLCETTESFSASSKRLELLTIILTVLTVILAISTIYDIFLK